MEKPRLSEIKDIFDKKQAIKQLVLFVGPTVEKSHE